MQSIEVEFQDMLLTSFRNFRVRDGIVTLEKYFIPDKKVLRNKLLMSYHDNTGLIRRQKTFELSKIDCVPGRNYLKMSKTISNNVCRLSKK